MPQLSGLLAKLPQRDRVILSQLRTQILEIQGQLDMLSARNKALIHTALEFVRFSLDVLTDAAFQPARLQRRDQRRQDACARCPDRMTERRCTTIDVELVRRNAQIICCDHGDHGKRLVDFEQIDIVDAPPGLGKQIANRWHGRGREQGRRMGMRGMSDHARDDRHPVRRRHALPRHHERRRAIRNRRCVRSSNSAVLGKGGF